MTAPSDAAAIVLSAGRSERFGAQNKLLHEIHGVPIIRHTVEAVLGAHLAEVIIVTGHDADHVEPALAGLAVKCVRNATPWAGMGTSLAVGANAVKSGYSGIFVMLGDMPKLQSSTLTRMLKDFDPKSGRDIAVPITNGRRGHPVLFGSRHFPQLCALSGDDGARQILKDHPERVQAVQVDDPGILFDIDTPEDAASAD